MIYCSKHQGKDTTVSPGQLECLFCSEPRLVFFPCSILVEKAEKEEDR